jgi:hypothetical protein
VPSAAGTAGLGRQDGVAIEIERLLEFREVEAVLCQIGLPLRLVVAELAPLSFPVAAAPR